MYKLLVTTLCLSTVAAAAGVASSADTAKPADDKKAVAALIRNTVDSVLPVLKNEKLSRENKRELVMKIIEPVVDFPLMAKLSLGRTHGQKIAPKQRDLFTKLFIETLKASYVEKLDLFSDEVVEFNDPVPKKSKDHVVTYIVSKGERIEVTYKIYKKEDAWKVYDFVIEGISIVKSFGSQYNEFLRESSFEELLAKMQEKIEAAAKEEKSRTEADSASKEPKETKKSSETGEKEETSSSL
jgi:phospholipid transport system substrate-binding protein